MVCLCPLDGYWEQGFLGFFAGLVDKAVVIVSTHAHTDEDLERDIPKGVAFFASLKPLGK